MHSRAQMSTEFFILMGLAFLIAIAFELVSLDQLTDFRIKNENDAVKDLALKLQKELIIAANVEDGYVRVFQVPSKLASIDYSLETMNSTITVQSKNALYIVTIPKTIGNVSKGINTINKTSGIIYINSAPPVYTFTETSICQNAQSFGLCIGLDLVYGPGYQTLCCSEHFICC